MVSDNAAFAEPELPSVTLAVKLDDPVAVGVPDIVPPADRFKPAGSVPLAFDHEYGGDPSAAARACE
jgi:hypothetical protein